MPSAPATAALGMDGPGSRSPHRVDGGRALGLPDCVAARMVGRRRGQTGFDRFLLSSIRTRRRLGS